MHDAELTLSETESIDLSIFCIFKIVFFHISGIVCAAYICICMHIAFFYIYCISRL